MSVVKRPRDFIIETIIAVVLCHGARVLWASCGVPGFDLYEAPRNSGSVTANGPMVVIGVRSR